MSKPAAAATTGDPPVLIEPPRPPKVVITQPSSNNLMPRVSIDTVDSYTQESTKNKCCTIL